MASGLTRFGNDLYTGQRSVPFIGLRRIWLTIGVILMVIAIAVPFIRGGGNPGAGFNFGIEFRGGSQFQVSDAQAGDDGEIDPTLAEEAVHSVVDDAVVHVTTVGENGVRVQTDQLTNPQTQEVGLALQEAYDTTEVTSSFVGPTWGADITRQALLGLGVFLGLALIMMAIYFRTWKMSMAAILSLLHDLVITVGVYAATGFEITPAAVIGFLTILGFSLYDTVVVFDKIRENTAELLGRRNPNLRRDGQPGGQPDSGAIDQHRCRRGAAGCRDPLPRSLRARRRHAARHLARAARRNRHRHLLDAVHRLAALRTVPGA